MRDAPKRILAWTVNGWGSAWAVAPEDAAPGAVEYIRGDTHAAALAELDDMKALHTEDMALCSQMQIETEIAQEQLAAALESADLEEMQLQEAHEVEGCLRAELAAALARIERLEAALTIDPWVCALTFTVHKRNID